MSMRLILRLAFVAFPVVASAATPASLTASPPEPVFVENFADELEPRWFERWIISPQLASELHSMRVGIVADPIGKTVGRVTVQEGDALAGAGAAVRAAKGYVCDETGSRATAMEAQPGGVAPTERAEMQIKTNRATG